MPPPSKSSLGPTRQRGVVTILTASVLMLLLLVMVLALDTGRLYLEKRKLQNIADMAVLSAVARMPPGKCEEVDTNIKGAANENGFDSERDRWEAIACDNGYVDIKVLRDAPTSLILGGLFRESTTLNASATAGRSEPVAAFTVSSQLLELRNSGLVGSILNSVGLSIEALGPEGVLNTSIKPSAILSALGVDLTLENLRLLTTNELAKIRNLDVKKIINTSLIVAGGSSLSSTTESRINSIGADGIDFFGDNGIIRIPSGDIEVTRAALETEIKVSDILGAALLVSNGQNAVNLEVNALSLVKIDLKLINSPNITIGPVETVAKSSQLEANIDIANGLIPLTLELLSAEAELTEISCSSTPTATFSLSSSIARVSSHLSEQSKDQLEDTLSVGNSNEETINENNPQSPPIEAGSSEVIETHSLASSLISELITITPPPQQECIPIPLLGCVISGVLDTTLNLVGGITLLVTDLLAEIVDLVGVDKLIDTILKDALGLEIGNTEIYVDSISCGAPILVE